MRSSWRWAANDPILTLTRPIAEPQSCRLHDPELLRGQGRNPDHALPREPHENRTPLASSTGSPRWHRLFRSPPLIAGVTPCQDKACPQPATCSKLPRGLSCRRGCFDERT
jgi:hypothetical protein